MARDQSTAGIDSFGHAWRVTPWGARKYIGSPNGLPGREGVDWGWTDNASEAMILTPYWQRRFKADQRRCGIRVVT